MIELLISDMGFYSNKYDFCYLKQKLNKITKCKYFPLEFDNEYIEIISHSYKYKVNKITRFI